MLVMNRNRPDALMVGVEQAKVLNIPGVRTALSIAQFRDGELSLARSAHLADISLEDFITHIPSRDRGHRTTNARS